VQQTRIKQITEKAIANLALIARGTPFRWWRCNPTSYEGSAGRRHCVRFDRAIRSERHSAGTHDSVGVVQPFSGFGPDCKIADGYVEPIDAPGFGLEQKPDLNSVIQQVLA
jgi:hypothetical protein